jgi:hypothetical protein
MLGKRKLWYLLSHKDTDALTAIVATATIAIRSAVFHDRRIVLERKLIDFLIGFVKT